MMPGQAAFVRRMGVEPVLGDIYPEDPSLPGSDQIVERVVTRLRGGSIVILSRGFGNCRITSTAARHVWRVQYFNNMQTLILNTIEVTPMPEAAVAAREDLVETRGRLADLVDWMSEQVADA